MLNIVIPMAGRGSRFRDAGYESPKPLIPVHGKPMLSLVIQNIRPQQKHRFIFICLKDHLENYRLEPTLRQWAPECAIVPIDCVTEGAACTVLLAKSYINNMDGLMIANSDQWVDVDINRYLASQKENGWDGLIMTMTANDSKWSYVRLNEENLVTTVVEKQVVSPEATVGVYNYREGRLYVEAAESMIHKNLRVNNEFYVAPAYNEMIAKGARVGIYNVGRELAGMYGLGIPSDLEQFMALPVSQKAVQF